MAIFKGAGVAITTPFFENGEVDYDTFRDQIESQSPEYACSISLSKPQISHVVSHEFSYS